MLKQLTLAVLAAGLLPACIITDGNTTTDASATSSATEGGSTSTASGTTTDSGNPTSEGTTDSASGTTVDVPTTESPTTDSPSTSATTDNTTTATTDNTTGVSGYGKCGWYAAEKYYTCEGGGGVPGEADPDGVSPIDCPPGLVAGDKCDEENGPINGVGCCTPEGTNIYCDSLNAMVIVVEECGV